MPFTFLFAISYMALSIVNFTVPVLQTSFCPSLVDAGSLKMSSSDREVLLALYQVTDGLKWKNESNWETNDDISLWYGVTVRGGRVVKLSLGHIWPGSKYNQGNSPFYLP